LPSQNTIFVYDTIKVMHFCYLFKWS